MSTPQQPARRTLATDFGATSFTDRAVSLFDLHRERLASGKAVLEGLTFDNCLIEGPAVMLVVGGVVFDGVDFGYTGGDIRNLVLRPASPTKVVGAIPVKDCRFTNSQFFAVGFTGSDDFLNQLLAVEAPS